MNRCGCERRNLNPITDSDEDLNFTPDKNRCRFFATSRMRMWRRQNSIALLNFFYRPLCIGLSLFFISDPVVI